MFTTHLSNFTQLPDFISITESWLTDNDNILDYKIDNYHDPIHINRPTKNSDDLSRGRGGLITYIKKT